MSIIPFKPPSTLELEGRALKKIADLTATLPLYVEAHRRVHAVGPATEDAAQVTQHFAFLQFIDDALALLEDIAPVLVAQHDEWCADPVFKLQCSLAKWRMKVFAEIRCSRVFVRDFAVMLEEREFMPALFAA